MISHPVPQLFPMIPSAQLNALLIQIHRSLLQYVGEIWPWGSDVAAQATVTRVVAEEQELTSRLSLLLEQRGHWLEWGVYPTNFTGLHYVSLDYLLKRLTVLQRETIAAARSLEKAAVGDVEATALLRNIVATLERHATELDRLAAAKRAA